MHVFLALIHANLWKRAAHVSQTSFLNGGGLSHCWSSLPLWPWTKYLTFLKQILLILYSLSTLLSFPYSQTPILLRVTIGPTKHCCISQLPLQLELAMGWDSSQCCVIDLVPFQEFILKEADLAAMCFLPSIQGFSTLALLADIWGQIIIVLICRELSYRL